MNKKCQIFTPRDYVEKLLDGVNYKKNLFGKKVLENSCGNGNVLEEIVRRYIDDCKKSGCTNKIIKKGLESDICGYEIDTKHYNRCIKRLDDLTETYNIININWNIKKRRLFKGKQSSRV